MRSGRHSSQIACRAAPVLLGTALLSIAIGAGATPPSPSPLDPLYDRIAADLAAGRPIVATVYVALCDNASQGIAPVRNKAICNGDDPANNMYWASKGGLSGFLRRDGWTRVANVETPDGPVLVRSVWRRSLPVGGRLAARGLRGRVPVYVVGLAYRGREIRAATVDYFHAVHRDAPLEVVTDSGERIAAGGASHVVGYQGHDYFYDTVYPEQLLAEAAGDSSLEKGAFALACTGNSLIRPGLVRPNVEILLLNRTLAFPGAWSVGGLLRGLALGRSGGGIRREAGLAFARGMRIPPGAAIGGFAYGD